MKRSSKFGLLVLALISATSARAQVLDVTSTSPEQVAIAQKLIDRHFEIWNSSDSSKYKKTFDEIYTKDFFAANYKGIAKGYDAIVALIEKTQSEHPGFKFSPKPITINHGLGRVTWGYGPRENPNLVAGEDIFTIDDGKISSARVFLNNK
jgi:hypothetical protein